MKVLTGVGDGRGVVAGGRGRRRCGERPGAVGGVRAELPRGRSSALASPVREPRATASPAPGPRAHALYRHRGGTRRRRYHVL